MRDSPEFDEAAVHEQWAKWADLCKVTASLEANNFHTAAAAFFAYVAGRSGSLDEAFGLAAPTRRRGAPADPDRGLMIAREIDPLKRQGKTWEAIEEALDKPGSLGRGLTVRQLRRHYDAHFDRDSGGVPEWLRTPKEIEAIAEKVVRRPRKKDAAARSERSRASRIARPSKPAKSKPSMRSATG